MRFGAAIADLKPLLCGRTAQAAGQPFNLWSARYLDRLRLFAQYAFMRSATAFR
jgi:hypothetical protein